MITYVPIGCGVFYFTFNPSMFDPKINIFALQMQIISQP